MSPPQAESGSLAESTPPAIGGRDLEALRSMGQDALDRVCYHYVLTATLVPRPAGEPVTFAHDYLTQLAGEPPQWSRDDGGRDVVAWRFVDYRRAAAVQERLMSGLSLTGLRLDGVRQPSARERNATPALPEPPGDAE